jgi:hypothetical protein
MTLWLTLFAATWAVYLALAARCARKNLLEAVEILIVIAGSSIGFFSRTVLDGTSTTLGALRGATLVALLVLVVSLGQPARIFDPPGIKARTRRRLPRAERDALERRETYSVFSQLAFVSALIVAITIYVTMDLTFLD